MTKHIEDCPACAQSLESITEMVSIMHKIKAINPPADFIDNVNKRLDELPFWEKVFLGLRNFFPRTSSARAFALVATIVLVIAVNNQLNMLPAKHRGLINEQDAFILTERDVQESQLTSHEEIQSAKKKSIISQTSGRLAKQEIADSSKPAALQIGDSEAALDAYSPAGLELKVQDKAFLSLAEAAKPSSEGNEQKQVLIIDFDELFSKQQISKILSTYNATQVFNSVEESQEIFSFNITYENFLKLQLFLAGSGTLQKDSADINLSNNKNTFSSDKEAFEQLISVELRILK